MIIASHIILTGYGHWLPNDPRGSMSVKTYSPELAPLGQTHFGRKTQQPSRTELKAFHRKARPRLAYEQVWFDEAARPLIAQAIGGVIHHSKFTCYACAVLPNHVHLLIRRHRIRPDEMARLLRDRARKAIVEVGTVPPEHPVFSADRCILYKSDPQSVRACIAYIRRNPTRHGLPAQDYPFVTPYDDWPFHKTEGSAIAPPAACQ